MNNIEIIKELNVRSSYKEHNLGVTLYEYVLKEKPTKIVEFGVLDGYSTIAFALALKELGRGKVYAYDIWEDYEFKHGNLHEVQNRIHSLELGEYVELRHADVYEWTQSPTVEFDMIHIDVSNNGPRLEKIIGNLKAHFAETRNHRPILFEGGTHERDYRGWLTDENKVDDEKWITLRKSEFRYRVLDERFPGISIIEPFASKRIREFKLEQYETNEGMMVPFYKEGEGIVPDHKARMIYYTTMKKGTTKGPMLHRRKDNYITCVQGDVLVKALPVHGRDVHYPLYPGTGLFIPAGHVVSYYANQDSIILNATDKIWTAEDPDTEKWKDWEDFCCNPNKNL